MQELENKCTACGEEIVADRLATTFVENGTEKRMHDPCLARLEPARRRDIKVVE